MSRVCQMTGKRTKRGNTRSHALNATRRDFRPNLFVKKVVDPKTGKMKKITISASGLRTLTKNQGALGIGL